MANLSHLFVPLGLLAVGACGSDDAGGEGPTPDGGVVSDASPVDDASDSGDASAVSCATEPTFADGLSPGRIIHVSTTGDNSTADGSEAKPFRTIARGAAEATPGTAVRVHAGTYAGGTFIDDLRGTASAPIWIGGAPGQDRPVISGGTEGLHLTRVSHVVVHDLEVTGSSQNGINCDDGSAFDDPTATHHVVFRDLRIHEVGTGGNQDCLKLSGVRDYWVLNSEFSTCGGSTGSGVDHVGCHRGTLAGNHFHEFGGNAIQAKGGSADIVIRGNLMENAGVRALNLGGKTGVRFFRPPLSTTEPNAEARRLVAYANVIIGSEAPVAFVGCVDCVFANNTVIDPTNWVARILQEAVTNATHEFEPAKNGRFVNNLISFERSDLSTFINVGSNTAPDTFTFANNLWFAHDDPARSTPSLPVTETGAVIGQDPVLDATHAISSDSPAAGAGVPVPEVQGDFAGDCYANPPSIGAFASP